MSDEFVTFSIRVPKALHEKLKKLARTEHRTLNGQAVMILDNAVKGKK